MGKKGKNRGRTGKSSEETRKAKRSHQDSSGARGRSGPAGSESGETRASEALTVAWTVSVTTVLLCNLLAVGVHFLAGMVFDPQSPPARWTQALGNLALYSGAVIGLVSLGLLPAVYRVRRMPPPPGYVGFAVLVCIAPILAIVALALR